MNINGEARLYVLAKLSPNEQVHFQYPNPAGALTISTCTKVENPTCRVD